VTDYTPLWENPLTEPEKHCALYAKLHYEHNDLRDDLRVIYSMNSDVLADDQTLFENLVHRTLVNLAGPQSFTEHAGKWLSDTLSSSEIRPSDVIEAYISRIAMTETNGELDDVEPRRIDHDRLQPVVPRD